jgi:hypothetical protein
VQTLADNADRGLVDRCPVSSATIAQLNSVPGTSAVCESTALSSAILRLFDYP